MTGEGRGRGAFYWAGAGCGAYRKHPVLAPRVCGAPPTWVGLRYVESPRPVVVRAYACDEHRAELDVARLITPADAPERQRRLDGERPEPLAHGREARELINAAYRWAERHAGHSSAE